MPDALERPLPLRHPGHAEKPLCARVGDDILDGADIGARRKASHIGGGRPGPVKVGDGLNAVTHARNGIPRDGDPIARGAGNRRNGQFSANEVDVLLPVECLQESGVSGIMGEYPEFDLAVIG